MKDEREVESKPKGGSPALGQTDSKKSTENSELALVAHELLKPAEAPSPDLATSSLPEAHKKPNPFRFLEEPEEADEERRNLTTATNVTAASVLPTGFGERVDLSDLSKPKYLNPTKRRKMSFTDFEKRVEEGNLILLDLIVSCRGETTILEYLENQIVNVFEITKTFEDGRGFLVHAIQRGFENVIEKLISLNSDIIFLPDLWGRVALHYACQSSSFEIVKTLIAAGSPLNHADKQGNTPLHFALMFGNKPAAVYLISQGAEKNPTNAFGVNPLDHVDCMDYLAFSSTGLVAGPSEYRPRDGLKADTMYRRRWDLYRRRKLIKGLEDRTEFKDCYTERDKGRVIRHTTTPGTGDSLRLPSNTEIGPKPTKPTEEQQEKNRGMTELPVFTPNTLPDSQKPPQPDTNSHLRAASPSDPAATGLLPSPTDLIAKYELSISKSESLEQDSLTVNGSHAAKITHRDFLLKDVIGSGSFGEVYLVSFNRDEKLYAMKVYSKQKIIRTGLLKFLFLEKRILMNFDHPFIVKVHSAFQSPRKLYLVMEYCRFKDLGQYLTKFEKMPEYQARILIAEVVLAVEELHRRNIIHRDIKPDNILIDEDGHIKITDFGLSKDNIGKHQLTSTFCGSIAYLPPEVVKRVGHGQQADWYLVGELLFESVFGIPPFFHSSKKVLLNSIINDEVQFPAYINRTTKDFILRLLEKDPAKRLGASSGARELKRHPFFAGVDWQQVFQKKVKLFDTSEITPYQWQSHDQDIVDRVDSRSHAQRIMNWSIAR